MLLTHKRNLAKRGYPSAKLNRELKKIQFLMRINKTLKNKKQHKQKPNNTNDKPTFITRYCPNAGRPFRLVHKHWTSISTDNAHLNRFLKNTPRLSYKSNPNFAKKLVRAKLKQLEDLTNTSDGQPYPQSNTDIIQKADLKYIIDKNDHTQFSYCSDYHCPLHDRMILSQHVRSKITHRT